MKRNWIVFLVLCLAALSLYCGKKDHKEFLNGKWKSEIYDMELNFTEGRMKVQLKLGGLTDDKENKVEYVETTKNGAIIKSPDSISDIIIIDDNHIKIQRQGSPLAIDLEREMKK